jgi:hypothetical protein
VLTQEVAALFDSASINVKVTLVTTPAGQAITLVDGAVASVSARSSVEAGEGSTRVHFAVEARDTVTTYL